MRPPEINKPEAPRPGSRLPRYPEYCPHCAEPVRRYRRVSAVIGGSRRERSVAAHYHLTFAGACVGSHLHRCSACGGLFRSCDTDCDWKPPAPLSAGWGALRVSGCEHEDAQLVDLLKTQVNGGEKVNSSDLNRHDDHNVE